MNHLLSVTLEIMSEVIFVERYSMHLKSLRIKAVYLEVDNE